MLLASLGARSKFPKLNEKMLVQLDEMMTRDIPNLMDSLPSELKSEQSDGLPQGRSPKKNKKSNSQPPAPSHEENLKLSALSAAMPDVQVPDTHRAQPPPPPQPSEINPIGDEAEEDTNPFGSSDEESDAPPTPWILQEEKDNKWDAVFMDRRVSEASEP